MRAIDGDALIDKYGEWYTEEGTEEGYIGTIKGIVDGMPTIEPERKTGKWIDQITCSECGWEMFDDVVCSPNRVWFPYCPNCGSKMEEGEQE